MKKPFAVLVLFLALGQGALKGQAALLVLIFGEKVATENFYFSLKAGLNYSMISGYGEGRNRLGATFGLVNNIRINDRWYFTPEFLPLSARGKSGVPILTTGKTELDTLLISPESTDRRLNYLDIPLLFRYHVRPKFRISVGPVVSFLTSATDNYRSEPINNTVLTTEIDISDALSKVDVGMVLDLSIVLSPPKNGKGVNLFLRVNQGFLDISREDDGNRFTHTLLQVGATFPFVEVPDEK